MRRCVLSLCCVVKFADALFCKRSHTLLILCGVVQIHKGLVEVNEMFIDLAKIIREQQVSVHMVPRVGSGDQYTPHHITII